MDFDSCWPFSLSLWSVIVSAASCYQPCWHLTMMPFLLQWLPLTACLCLCVSVEHWCKVTCQIFVIFYTNILNACLSIDCSAFKAHHPGTTFYFASERQDDRGKWVENLIHLAGILCVAHSIYTCTLSKQLHWDLERCIIGDHFDFDCCHICKHFDLLYMVL